MEQSPTPAHEQRSLADARRKPARHRAGHGGGLSPRFSFFSPRASAVDRRGAERVERAASIWAVDIDSTSGVNGSAGGRCPSRTAQVNAARACPSLLSLFLPLLDLFARTTKDEMSKTH